MSGRGKEAERMDRKLRDIRENRAARTIQRGWRQHVQEEEEVGDGSHDFIINFYVYICLLNFMFQRLNQLR